VILYGYVKQDLINLALRQPKTCSIIYVPVDTTQSAIEAVVKNKPFLRMSLLDNSDFAAMETADNKDQRKRVALDEVLRDEDFITAEVSLFRVISDMYSGSEPYTHCFRNTQQEESRSISGKKKTVGTITTCPSMTRRTDEYSRL
jgi:hypothetical protein